MRSNAQRFQEKVAGLLYRNKSILDIMTKYQVTNARVNRSVIKAVTGCGCVSIDGRKSIPSFEFSEHDSQVYGSLCEDCRRNIESEIGENLFYAASLCSALGINFECVLEREISRVESLGRYNLR
ncbi:MAG: DUF1573 domain-containing protein [Clostridia bacterium]|nr:DUF1573 domain-containing protein [Clostridia bacterium]